MGTDGLGNDWYRDSEFFLVPLLTRIFTVCALENILPRTFGHAAVACILKSKSAALSRYYRPISLLNSNYKIITRLTLSASGQCYQILGIRYRLALCLEGRYRRLYISSRLLKYVPAPILIFNVR